MRVTAADDAARRLKMRQGDVKAVVVQYATEKGKPEKYRIYTDPTVKTPAAKEVITLLGLVRMPATVLHDLEIPKGSFVWVFPDNVNRY
jgi:hypothetical protein